MSLAEELSKLETVDVAESHRLVQRWRRKLNDAREPDLLAELVDYQLSTQSRAALRILIALKDLYSQDFFAKINDCLHRLSTCLPALKLLSHMLTGQTSWLYKIVHSPVFPALLKLLRPNTSIVIVTSAVYLLSALIPLSPYHVTPHLPDIFESFTQLATLSTADSIGKENLSHELLLAVKTSVYFLFLQLYALYPCSFVQYLKGRFGPTGEVQVYQEYIAPLFHYVQFHPNLIVELPSQETQRTKWSSRDPNEIATLALSLCVDPNLVPLSTDTPLLEELPSKGSPSSSSSSSSSTNSTAPARLKLPQADHKICGPLSANELAEVWSPSLALGLAPPTDTLGGNDSPVPVHLSVTPSGLSEPVSLDSSVQSTPLLPKAVRHSPLFNYSPTASVEADTASLMSTLTNEKARDSPLSFAAVTTNTVDSPDGPSSDRGVASRSLTERFSSIFRRRGGPNFEQRGRGEEFATVSISEYNDGRPQQESNPNESSHTSSLSAEEGEEEIETAPVSDCRSDTIGHPIVGGVSLPARLRPDVEQTVYLASEKLQRIVDSRDCQIASFANAASVREASCRTLDDITLTPTNKNSLLVSRSVLKEKREAIKKSPGLTSMSSPLAALDVFIETGRVLHGVSNGGVSLSDMEGIDWDHYGCCPHTEELGVMSRIVAVLHGQLLFERYQCQLHAKRNRRLMTRARHVSKLENEIVALRHRLHQQEGVIECLKSGRASHSPAAAVTSNTSTHSLIELKQLQTAKEDLEEEVRRLRQQVCQLKTKNQDISQTLRDSQGSTFTLKQEVEEMKTKLSQGDNLRTELQSLTKEHLLLEELYRQQQLTLGTLRRESTQTQQLKEVNESLAREKEHSVSALAALKKELARLSAHLKEKEEEIVQRDSQISALKTTLQLVQERHKEKIKSLENKYQTIKNINKELEEFTLLSKTTKSHRSRTHKRTDSTSCQGLAASSSSTGLAQSPVCPSPVN